MQLLNHFILPKEHPTTDRIHFHFIRNNITRNMHKQQETLSMIKVKDTLAHQRKHEF